MAAFTWLRVVFFHRNCSPTRPDIHFLKNCLIIGAAAEHGLLGAVVQAATAAADELRQT